MTAIDIPAGKPLAQTRMLDMTTGGTSAIWFGILTFLALWGAAVLSFGLPGLYLPALAMVPVMIGLIVVYAWG